MSYRLHLSKKMFIFLARKFIERIHMTKQKKTICISAGIVLVLVISYLSLPYYARQALIHLMPVIDDLETFLS